MVEVERVLSGQRAVEPGLEVGGPAAPVLVRTAAVRLADARDAGVDGLQRRSINNGEREEGWGAAGGGGISFLSRLVLVCLQCVVTLPVS